MEVINKRRSVRKFNDKLIEDNDLNLLIRAGMQAPTAVNQQANAFYVVKKKENLLKLANLLSNASMLSTASVALIVLIDKSKLKREIMMQQDAASATTLILLEATSMGVGSCWCGIYPNSDRMQAVNDVLKINDNFIVFSLIALGYPEADDALRFIDRYDESKIYFD